MDVSWSDNYGRLVFRMSNDSPRAKQFLLICTGEKGVTYKGSRFYKLQNEGHPGEILCGGEMQSNNDNESNEAQSHLVEGIEDGGIYYRNLTRGVLAGPRYNMSDKALVFGVCTKDHKESKFRTAFGEIEEGMALLSLACQHSPLTDIVVKESGIMIPL